MLKTKTCNPFLVPKRLCRRKFRGGKARCYQVLSDTMLKAKAWYPFLVSQSLSRQKSLEGKARYYHVLSDKMKANTWYPFLVFETRLRIIMTLEKLEGRRNLMGKACQPIDRVEPPRPPVITESEAKEVCWYMWRSLACPSTSRTLFSGLWVSAHGKQVALYWPGF